jgi:hypothetical protein
MVGVPIALTMYHLYYWVLGCCGLVGTVSMLGPHLPLVSRQGKPSQTRTSVLQLLWVRCALVVVFFYHNEHYLRVVCSDVGIL